MIISASRRTDIPAFHSEWFMERIRNGYVMVRNPVAEDVVYRVDLKPENVDCLSLISKNPKPIEKYLDELRESYEILFQITVNPYGVDTEPNVPDTDDVIDSFIRISDILGKGHVMWRYDPVIFNDEYDIDFHRKSFDYISDRLKGHTDRCIFSFLSIYDKIIHVRGLRPVSDSEKDAFMKSVREISVRDNIEMSSCCFSAEKYGIIRRGCTDGKLLKSLGIPFDPKLSHYRDGCLCVRSIDIGAYDTCMHCCTYCYANDPDGRKRSSAQYDIHSEMLNDSPKDTDRVIELGSRVNRRITDFV